MRKFYFIILLFLLAIACEKREAEPVEVPVWLESRITELDSSDCTGCSITRYTYMEEYFYQVYCNHWSCVNCEVYHYNGALVVWGDDVDPADFDQNKTRPVKIWECNSDAENQ